MAKCEKTTAKCAKKAPADLKAVKPAAAEKVTGGAKTKKTKFPYVYRAAF
jgi:hypothetical protein